MGVRGENRHIKRGGKVRREAIQDASKPRQELQRSRSAAEVSSSEITRFTPTVCILILDDYEIENLASLRCSCDNICLDIFFCISKD